MKKNNNKKTWKKTHRERSKLREIIEQIQLDPELREQLREYREKRGLSEQQAIRRILKFAMLMKEDRGAGEQ